MDAPELEEHWSTKEVLTDLRSEVRSRFDRVDNQLIQVATKDDLHQVNGRVDRVEARLRPLEDAYDNEVAITQYRAKRWRIALTVAASVIIPGATAMGTWIAVAHP